jgi:threonine/homoserine/homoserine lactone efflux protein
VLVGMIAAASNPMSVIMWLAVAGVAPASGIAELQPVHGVIISAGYLLGALTWAMLIALFVGWSRRFVQPHVWRWWNVGSGVLLGAFALRLVWTAATLPVEVTNYFLIRSYQ